jgi:CDP-6-deoxy-D-xylo-4-hexulose-3-dehydrase
MKTQISKNEINNLKKIIDKNSEKILRNYQLSPNSFSNEDIIEGIKVIISKKITMSKKTIEFEKKFAKFIGCKYALMVNSGSSANLLALFAMINPAKKNRLKQGDECLIPAVCWSTSLWPIVQAGLKPKFVDVDPHTLNLSVSDLKKKNNEKN